MKNLILKTALISVAILSAAALAVFALWILISPQTMASTCEQTGNFSFAVTCADLRYKYTNEVSDLARCAEDGILSGRDSLIIKYCERLIDDADFEKLCEEKDDALSGGAYGEYTADYKIYITGHLSAAQYRSGDLDKAIDTALSGGAFNKLVLEVLQRGTADDAKKVLNALDGADSVLEQLLNNFINTGEVK